MYYKNLILQASIYIKRYSGVSQSGVFFCDNTHTHRLTFVCVSSHRQTFVCVCRHTMLVWQIGEGDSASKANRYVSEANRYVGEARKRPAGARILGP